jgi:anti-sigma factor RsiW
MSPMKHRWMRRAVGAYVDGEIDDAAAAAVSAHLRECWYCSGDAEQLRMIKQSLRNRRNGDALAVLRLRRFVARFTQ